ncbi:murein L,D-transpeptidase catalytic domain family protein [Nitritalea halalkaliphila]|uniref:murein L,D-transpeptidase catalytic domain family protein n=1 Tax=Nitritalea halalkaliphila TaxID=590849 RepID=UPI001EE67FBE|nr:murein L,D-transpeptidase catalytic domain family protein [Nitritalea halalkaliphila]
MNYSPETLYDLPREQEILPVAEEVHEAFWSALTAVYAQEELPSQEVLAFALNGTVRIAEERGEAYETLTVIDFSKPSDEKRLWVFDMQTKALVFHSLVAHGRQTGERYARHFSNQVNSYKSSLGFYKTAETYQGKHGYSLRLDGLEPGINDAARERAVVMHGADYAEEDFIRAHGRLGRSLGCPAIPRALAAPLLGYIQERGLLFIYAEEPTYLEQSAFIAAL